MWVYLSNTSGGHLEVFVDPPFDIERYDLDLFLDGVQLCNTQRMYSDEGQYEMGCSRPDRDHSAIQRISAQTPKGDLRCGRNTASDVSESVFACRWRR